MVYQQTYIGNDTVYGEVVTYVVYADKQEYLGWLMGRNLEQTGINTQGHITANTTVAHVGLAQFLGPIASTFGKAVAQHHDIGRADGWFGLKSTHPSVVITRESGSLVGYACSYGIGYLGAQTYHIGGVYGVNAVAK